jgi:hypothetical protein
VPDFPRGQNTLQIWNDEVQRGMIALSAKIDKRLCAQNNELLSHRQEW